MDHSDGFEVAPGLLPSVTVLKPGLALCLKHSQVDKRYVDSHIEQLDQNLPKELRTSFQLYDTSSSQLEYVLEYLERRRAEALKSNRLYMIFSPHFAPRYLHLLRVVDHVFYYAPGLSAPLLTPSKVNGKVCTYTEAMVIQRTPRRNEERKRLNITLPAGVNSQDAVKIISEAITSRYSGSFEIGEVPNEQ